MHSTELGPNNVPAFLTKLWKLVDDSKYELIHWAPNGQSFIIHDQTQFSKEVLPQYFKHNNMASFIRQLNMYGFKKLVNIEQGGLKSDKDEMEFQHQYFIKDNENFLTLIKRKLPGSRNTPEDVKVKPDVVNRMLADVHQLSRHQETMESKFQSMKHENEALWRELASLRQKHNKQQQIVNKLIQFLITIVRPNRGIALKRKLPLMLNDTSSHTLENKVPNLSRHYPSLETASTAARKNDDSSPSCKIGPVIHDVTDTLETGDEILIPQNIGEIISDDPDIDPIQLAAEAAEVPYVEECLTSPKTEFPASPSIQPVAGCSQSDLPVDLRLSESESEKLPSDGIILADPLETVLQSVMAEDETNLDTSSEVALFASSSLDQALTTEIASQINNSQTNLESLRELLSGGSSYNLSASTLLGLFNPDESLPNSGLFDDISLGDKNEITGNELVQYTPSLLEMTEDDATGFDFGEQPDSLLYGIDSILSNVNADSVLTTPDPMLSAPNFCLGKRQSKSKTS